MEATVIQNWLDIAEIQMEAARKAAREGDIISATLYARNAKGSLCMITRESERAPEAKKETVIEECMRLANEATRKNG